MQQLILLNGFECGVWTGDSCKLCALFIAIRKCIDVVGIVLEL